MAYVEYPRWVYGPEGQSKVISSPEEWPAGWAAHPRDLVAQPPEALPQEPLKRGRGRPPKFARDAVLDGDG